MCFTSAQGTSTNIGHIPGHKTSFDKLQMIEIMYSYRSGIEVESNNNNHLRYRKGLDKIQYPFMISK